MIKVIPYAANPIFQPVQTPEVDASIRREYGIHENYILFLGILAQKKNLPTLLKAFAHMKRGGWYSGKLVIAGREYPQSREVSIRSIAHELGVEKSVVFTGPLPDSHLPSFYRGADLFAFPSLHEGFGIVLLEAMACGTPVVASATSSIPEVVGDAGLLIDEPLNELLWAETLNRVLRDAELRSTLAAKGIRRSQEFSWDNVGRATLESYMAAARGRRNVRPIEKLRI
jgi:glycosyltransferase involved in cell wall biosynthesis